ncbi:MAG: leucine-rich repeat domain-containing protein [Treponema sp.]|nr:leucine-rich repeat domain-containing protein [Treponema sp.]
MSKEKTMANRRFRSGMVMVLVLGLVLAGCSSKDSESGNWATSPRATSAYDFTYEVRDGTITITGLYRAAREVVIPGNVNGVSVTAIRNEAFRRKELISATIPNGVTSIGDDAFAQNQLIGTGVTIPNSVTSIGDRAFAQNQLTKVTIPNNVSSIGASAFSNNQLASVTIGNKVASIGAGAFSNNQLASVSIPNSVTEIGNGAFSNNKLTSITIPNNVTSIGGAAFSENPLTGVTIPAGVTSIEYAPFVLCPELTAINVSPNNSSYSSVDGVLYDKNAATLIQWPTAKTGSVSIPNSVTVIGRSAFSSIGLTSITIPDSVTVIERSAFYDNQLTSVTIGNRVSSIGEYAFAENQLTSVTIPDSVTTIGSSAFSSNQITRITIGADVTLATGNSPSFGSYFESTYNNYRRAAGTYTRPNANSSNWTRVNQ